MPHFPVISNTASRGRNIAVRPSLRAWWMLALALLLVLMLLHPAQADTQEQGWSNTVSRVANSVVSLQLSQLRSFDGAAQGTSNATGFVVDAEQGIVLTNRHVIGSGPIRISATFQNQERVDAVPLYRDPIHDFAFLRLSLIHI